MAKSPGRCEEGTQPATLRDRRAFGFGPLFGGSKRSTAETGIIQTGPRGASTRSAPGNLPSRTYCANVE